ncbi:transcriptional regulator [Treponema primitia ZAS-2]|uniref:Transcriptional regulator n=1 Tax=Treponema primitia (strain ATCC BAA-887 / DSM 12427 / ZAS-2) TaxID=545694 RepID=F5YPW5_TREPZ|nr:TetR-like C-terminal domain-containing protein [Treponema primitia]AEF83577.1 transcriptional regulator [Treponema primitia ZAS-2]
METKQNRKVLYTKKVLTEALVNLMQERSIADISIKELCALADINRSTFYAHYKNQYSILQELEDAAIKTFEQIVGKYVLQSPKTALLQTIKESLDLTADNVNWVRVLLSEQGDIHFQRKLFSLILKNEMMSFKNDEQLDDITKEYYLTFGLNGSVALVQYWIKNGMNIPKENLAHMLLKLNLQD